MNARRRAVLLVVVGPTASGKSDLAHAVALARKGEIISADAFAVYRGFDRGTAKPSPERRAEVPYHLIDVADPTEPYSAGRWQGEARAAVEAIAARGRLPIVCGGSGFYIRALLSGLPPAEPVDRQLRAALARWGRRHPDAVRRLLEVNDAPAAARIAPGNLRYLLRAVEILFATGRRPSEGLSHRDDWAGRFRVVKVGLRPESEDLYARILRRVREMLESGWEEEVGRLLAQGTPKDANAFEAIGYRELAEAHLSGGVQTPETEGKIVTATRQLAKRQATWLRRETGVAWLRPETALGQTLQILDAAIETEKSG